MVCKCSAAETVKTDLFVFGKNLHRPTSITKHKGELSTDLLNARINTRPWEAVQTELNRKETSITWILKHEELFKSKQKKYL